MESFEPPIAGRARIANAAADLISTATLEEVAGFLGPRSVARAAGVSVGTVTHHFPSDGESVARAAVSYALHRPGWNSLEQLAAGIADGLDDLTAEGERALPVLADVLIKDLLGYSPEVGARDSVVEAGETAAFLVAAVAPRDARAAAVMRTDSHAQREVTVALCRAVVDRLPRKWSDDVSADEFALTVNALAAGFLWFRRFDQDGTPLRIYAAMVMRLLEACTDPLVGEPHDYRQSLIPSGSRFGLDQEKRVAIAAAAVRVYERGRWPELTVAEVAREAAVSRPTVVANYQDRNGLAAAVWMTKQFVPLRQAAQRSDARTRPLHQTLRESLLGFVLAARADIDLTHAFLEGVFAYTVAHGVPDANDPADPRNLAPLPGLLVPIIEDNRRLFRPGNAGSETEIADTAALLTNHVLHLALTRPMRSATEVVDRIFDTTFAGMVTRKRQSH
jgi:AcrR family transcriptional regulator